MTVVACSTRALVNVRTRASAIASLAAAGIEANHVGAGRRSTSAGSARGTLVDINTSTSNKGVATEACGTLAGKAASRVEAHCMRGAGGNAAFALVDVIARHTIAFIASFARARVRTKRVCALCVRVAIVAPNALVYVRARNSRAGVSSLANAAVDATVLLAIRRRVAGCRTRANHELARVFGSKSKRFHRVV